MRLQLQTSWSSAHFYSQEKWSAAKNQETFGKCFSKYGHGHDYQLKVEWILKDLKNPKDISEIRRLEPALQQKLQELSEHFDHHHLNFVIPKFRHTIPTTENLASYCAEFLSPRLAASHLPEISSLKLYERPDLWVEISSLAGEFVF